ncbi:MAG: DUF4861 family protein [Prevotella sp.]|nr:DUF4861 family protein [Prevotella sp.]
MSARYTWHCSFLTRRWISRRWRITLGIKRQYKGERFHYYFGAAWSEYDVRSQEEWQARINGFIEARKNPLTVTLK